MICKNWFLLHCIDALQYYMHGIRSVLNLFLNREFAGGVTMSRETIIVEKFNNSANNKYLGFFFDVDGTLSNSYLLGFNSTNEVLRRHSIAPVTEEQYHEGTKYTTPMRLAWHVTGDPHHAIREDLGKEFDALYVDLVSAETTKLYDGIYDLLSYFRSRYPTLIRYAALSNACTGYVSSVLQVNDLEDIFQIGVGADQVPAPKPAPDGLWQICAKLHMAPNRCVYVGDSPTDGHAATAAGMHSIGVTWGSHCTERVSPAFAVTVHTVSELKDALLQFLTTTMVTTSHLEETNDISH